MEPMRGIAQGMRTFYESKYPDLRKPNNWKIRNAIDELQQIFRRTTFPEMKLNWQTHPNNLGHFYFNGCPLSRRTARQRRWKSNQERLQPVPDRPGQDEDTATVTAVPKLSFQHPDGLAT